MLRTWPALFAWGAGLLHLAIGASAIGSDRGWPAGAVLVSLIVLGGVELGWGALVLRTGRIIGGRGAALVAIAAVVIGGAAIAAGASPFAVAASSAVVAAGGSLAARLSKTREGRSGAGERPARSSRAGAAGMALGAILVAALVTPGLAQTDAGVNGFSHAHDRGVDLPLADPHAHH